MGYSRLATFTVSRPYDALRLRLFISNILNHAEYVSTSMADACPEVLDSVKNGTFHCWKQTVIEPFEDINDWRAGVG